MSCFGIDFGTTNSSAVELNDTFIYKYGDTQGNPLPSIVRIDIATGAASGGREVWDQRLSSDRDGRYNVFPCIKALLDGNDEWLFGTNVWTVPDLVAVVLRQLSDRAIDRGVPSGISRATFSIPVGSSARTRRVLRAGAKLAGIEVSGFVKESTAAVIRNRESVKHCRHVAVFDWGGGTLDISVLDIRSRSIFELATKGMPAAGNQIDMKIARFVHMEIMAARRTPRKFTEVSPFDRDHLIFRCEQAKCAFSTKQEVALGIEEYDGHPARMLLTRAMCEPFLLPIVGKAIKLLARTIAEAGLTPEQIDEIIVIGGSSQLWLLREQLEKDSRFDHVPWPKNPEWYVAHGAAILEQQPGSDCLAETLGLQWSDGEYHELAGPGERPFSRPRCVAVSLIEDVKEANILIDRWNDQNAEPTSAMRFAIPTLGFDMEPIQLHYRLTEDLTFQVRGRSAARGIQVEHESGELRFSYNLEQADEIQHKAAI